MYGRMAATTVLPAAVLLVLACARGAGGSSVGPPCSPALARQLSRNFNRYARMSHTNASSLPAYLATHGVLVSQCMNPPSCVVPTPPGYHLSGSWISAVQAKDGGDITDLHAIHSAIGSVVDLTKVNITCSFPSDGATATRDGRGCGPQSQDPWFGSEGASARLDPNKNQQLRASYSSLLRQKLGPGATWRNLSCLSPMPPLLPAVTDTNNLLNWSSWGPRNARSMQLCDTFKRAPGGEMMGVQSMLSWFSNLYSPILGHPLCLDPNPCVGASGAHGTCGANGMWEVRSY
jgi:hypothetical protein